MRGKEVFLVMNHFEPGITPAYAGKSHSHRSTFHSVQRITPAYAGKSGMSFMFAIREEDHPRLCGEKPMLSRPQKFTEGSPPPMRGKANRPCPQQRF